MKIFDNLAKKENKCVIIVTHSENIAKNVDKVFELKKFANGQLLQQGFW